MAESLYNCTERLKLNEEFVSWDDFNMCLVNYQKLNKQQFCIENSQLLKTHTIENVNNKCKYVHVKLVCKYGLRRHKYKGEYIRSTRTIKLGCAAFIKLSLSINKQCLKIKEIILEHNDHDGSEIFFDSLPENRKIKGDENEKHVEYLLRLGCSKARIRDDILKEKGIFVTAKDIHNFNRKLKNPDDMLHSAITLLENKYKASVDVFYEDQHKNFRALFFSTKDMTAQFDAWPEMMFIDTTYNLLKRKLIVLIMCVRDSNGFTHMIGIALLANEEAETLRSVFNFFKDKNAATCEKIKCIMTDKDLTERTVLKEIFPDANLFLCEFHVLKVFSRTITTTKMKITSAERYKVLNLLEKLVKCQSEKEYDYFYQKLCESAPASVLTYFNKNWHSNRLEWTRYALSNHNYGNYTNNSVESINARLKDEIPAHSSLSIFINNIFKYINRKNLTIKANLGVDIYKHPIQGYVKDTPEYLYENFLTSAAFKLLKSQICRRKPMSFLDIDKNLQICKIKYNFNTLHVTTEHCKCLDFKSNQLPCRHVFAVREYFHLPLYDEKLIPERWAQRYNLDNQSVLQSSKVKLPLVDSSSCYGQHSVPVRKAETFQSRLKLMNEICRYLAYCGSLATKNSFKQRLEILKFIETAWRNNEDVIVTKNDQLSAFSRLSLDNSQLKNEKKVLDEISENE